jgi:hypothetical protein
MGSNLLASGSVAVQQRSGVVCRRSKITVYHTPEGEEVWDISSEDDILMRSSRAVTDFGPSYINVTIFICD